MKKININLEKLMRDAGGINVWQLSVGTGVTRQTIYNWLAGRKQIDLAVAARFMEFFHCNIEELFDVAEVD